MRALALAALAVIATPAAAGAQYFALTVVDDATDAPVPCVTLRTVNRIALRTDATGTAAFYEPGLMDTDVWFYVEGEHVEHAADGFGLRGRRITITEGGRAELRVTVRGTPSCAATDVEARRIARGVPPPSGYFRIDVIDDVTERGVPLVELRLSDTAVGEDGRWVTDSAGVIAIDPLDLEGSQQPSIASHGYTFDGPTVALDVRAGGHLVIRAHRENLAERLYRVTGGGVYRDSVLLGLEVPLAAPVIDGLVVGQDTVFTTVHEGRLFWIWGDTNRPAYPLGNFRASGASSVLPEDGGLDPDVGVDLEYFVDADGFSRAMAPAETVPGEGVTWLGSLVSVPDASGVARLHATFGKYRSLTERTRFGMLTYDAATERFVESVAFDGPDERFPGNDGFVVQQADASWVYFHSGIRVPAGSEAMIDPRTYEAFTPFVGDVVQRDADGAPDYAWRAGGAVTTATTPGLGGRERLVSSLVDVDSGDPFEAHGNGGLQRNEFTGRFLRVITPRSRLGETWIAVADTPVGPWVHARRVLRHERYTFYNPRQHAALDVDHGRRIYFEGTYVTSFSGNDDPTPRYDYNQVMYALDLDRPELALPVAVYDEGELGTMRVVREGDGPIAARFFAFEHEAPGTVPVWWSGPSCEARTLHVGGTPETPPIFWALPPDAPAAAHLVPLFERWPEGGEPSYGVEPSEGARVIAKVLVSRTDVRVPVADTLSQPHPDAGPDRCLSEGPLELEPAPAGMQWQIDGRAVEGRVMIDEGLTTVELVAQRDDGLVRRDWMVVRVGEAPVPTRPPTIEGCACRASGGHGAPRSLGFVLALVATCVIVRARRR